MQSVADSRVALSNVDRDGRRIDTMEAARFNAELRRLRTATESAAYFRAAIAPFGFDSFASGDVDLERRERVVLHVVGWTEAWRKFYFDSSLIDRDPLLDALAYRDEPFTWSDLRRDRRLAQVGATALDTAAAEGWVEGLVVPMTRRRSMIGLVSLVGHQRDPAPETCAWLALISVCFYGHARILAARDGCVPVPAALTPREVECVRLVARGMSDRQISLSIGVAPSTAHEFVEKAKHRLGAKSRAELAAIAVSLGIVDI
jgi:DNA-binding CsgD family transcriptional regulator